MSATNFKTENNTLRKLMGNGLTYQIPRFQRDYSWTEDEWDDLWQDILGTIKEGGEPSHYMGYLVLQSSNDKLFDVIDGQQRLTTLSLIVLAVLKNLKNLIAAGREIENTQRRLDQLRSAYIGYLDPVTLVPRSKLSLNRNNNHYYQTYIIPLEKLPQRGFKASEHSLRKAFEWFEKRVSDYARQHGGTDPAMTLAQLVETMSDKLFFTVITVTDELNAYKVFETLNARGVRLSATDLLKNYLFSVLHKEGQHEHEMRVLEDRWESMVGRLSSESFPDFLRVHWNSRRSFVRQADLFKTISGKIKTLASVFDLLRDMEQDIDTYLALTQPDISNWPKGQKEYASTLRMFNVRQPYPLLLAAHRSFSMEDFTPLLRACVVISFRYNVIANLQTSEQERIYNQVAEKISSTSFTSTGEALAAMSSIYPRDDTFRAAFAEKSIRTTATRNRRVVRYILASLERHLCQTDLDFDSDTLTLEHVLPQNPTSGWDAFPEQDTDELASRLGNVTLLPKSQNRDLANQPYSEKRRAYQDCAITLTKKLGEENAYWTPDRLAARQNWMAQQATSIWRIGQLS
jgi:Protein of unknown function DUF262/Protein of unknown function (DUF1524)